MKENMYNIFDLFLENGYNIKQIIHTKRGVKIYTAKKRSHTIIFEYVHGYIDAVGVETRTLKMQSKNCVMMANLQVRHFSQ